MTNLTDDLGFGILIGLIFMFGLTIINIVILKYGIPLVHFIIGISFLFIGVAMLNTFEGMEYIPVFLILINLVIMIIGIARARD